MARLILMAVLLGGILGSVFAQGVYSRVELRPASLDEWQTWLDAGLVIDHFHSHNGNLEVVLDSTEIALLDELGAAYSILQYDLSAVYARTLPLQAKNLSQRAACGLTHFSPGSLSGFHTWDEAVAQLDSMHAHFPNLISPKISIGTSVEGRTLWAVKISDQPNLNESSSEAGVYFDALTHAREPLSLEAVLYYMWWLLENYGNNPEATYLINNREIFLVPVVNPDGYVYNQTTNPNGGGLWRKNRRITNTICSGIDLNRNFSFGWGINTGSTDDPCSNTFRGISAFSEPETQAIQSYLALVSPETGFSLHSYGQKILSPLGYVDSLVSPGLYSDMASEFIPERYNGYGTVKQLFNYHSSGTTLDYFHSLGMKGWMPEIGNNFWDDPGTICLRLREFLPAMKYITWAAGAFVRYQDYECGELLAGKNTTLSLRVRNKGLSQIANNVSVVLFPLTSGVQVNATGNTGLALLPGRENVVNFSLNVSPSANYMDTIRLAVITGFDGVITDRDTLQLWVGKQEILFEDNFDLGKGKWQSLGTGISWDTTSLERVGDKNYMTDSPRGSYRYDSNTGIVTSAFVDLTSAVNPVLEFSTRFSLEPFQDYVKIEVGNQTNATWKTLGGSYATAIGENFYYQGNRHWVNEKINLSEFIGQKIKIRFQLHSGTLVQSDGFYLCDLRIVDYSPSVTAITPDNAGPLFEVFPNPAADYFSVKITVSQSETLTLEILDIMGRIVWVEKEKKLKPGENEWPIDTQSFHSGVYIVRIMTEKGIGLKRIQIQ